MTHVLIYKQTHLDDPGDTGIFGINDCMGRVRGFDFDAVIAMLNNKVSWVGLGARKIPWPGHDPQVIFSHFASILPTQDHPAPPLLAKFMTGKRHIVRPVLTRSRSQLNIEIIVTLRIAIEAPPSKGGKGGKSGICHKVI
jgi:hypothetical protein